MIADLRWLRTPSVNRFSYIKGWQGCFAGFYPCSVEELYQSGDYVLLHDR